MYVTVFIVNQNACNIRKCSAIVFQGYQLLCIVVTRMYRFCFISNVHISTRCKFDQRKLDVLNETEEEKFELQCWISNTLVYILKANNHCNLWFVYNAYLHLISIIIIVTDVYAYICVYVCSFNIKSGNTQSGSYVGGHSITEHITSINHLNKWIYWVVALF